MLPILLALAGTALAASFSTTTVSLILPGFDPQPLVGSIVAAQADETTYAIACASPSNENCGLAGGTDTVIQGPSTWAYTISAGNSQEGGLLQKASCKLDPDKEIASCTVSASEDLGKSAVQTSSATVYHGYSDLMLPVVITAGPSSTASAPNSAASNAVSSSSTGTGAAPAITQNAILVGVAAVVGGAMVL